MNSLAKRCLVALSFALACGGALADGPDSLYAATLPAPDGKPVALEQYRGKPLLLNFWARWCAPCRTEIPELSKLQATYGKRGLKVLGIGIEDDGEAVKDFLKAYEVDYPVLLGKDKGLWLMQALGNARGMLPFTLVIDRNGQVVMRKFGVFKASDFETLAPTLLH